MVLVGLAGFVVGVYVLVVRGGGALIGHTDSPSLAASAWRRPWRWRCLFAPVQAALDRSHAAGVPAAASTPYDVLSRFSETVTGGDSDRGAAGPHGPSAGPGNRSRGGHRCGWPSPTGLTLAATWPADADQDRRPLAEPRPVPRRRHRRRAGGPWPCAHGGQLLGVLRLQERPGLPLTAVEERLFAGLAAQAGLVLRLAGLRAELEGQHARAGGAGRRAHGLSASGSSRPRTPSGDGWSGTFTTARSSTWWP